MVRPLFFDIFSSSLFHETVFILPFAFQAELMSFFFSRVNVGVCFFYQSLLFSILFFCFLLSSRAPLQSRLASPWADCAPFSLIFPLPRHCLFSRLALAERIFVRFRIPPPPAESLGPASLGILHFLSPPPPVCQLLNCERPLVLIFFPAPYHAGTLLGGSWA